MHLLIVVEGGTEQEFVKRCLAPHLRKRRVWTTPIEVTTKRDHKTGQKLSRGGGHWRAWRKDIILALKAKSVRVTSLFDLYGLPKDFPGLAKFSTERNTLRRAELLEAAMGEDIGDRRFIPYLQRHEFEALVLAGLEHLSGLLSDRDALKGLDALINELADVAPEEVNDSPKTAPSKRLLTCIPGYNKKAHGPQITEKVGIEGLKQRCHRFGAWVKQLEALDQVR